MVYINIRKSGRKSRKNEGKVNPGKDVFVDGIHQKVLELNGDEKLMEWFNLSEEDAKAYIKKFTE